MQEELDRPASPDNLGVTSEIRAENQSPSIVEKFVIRLPSGLRDKIKQLSEQNRRSMNSEIIMVLENYIRRQLLDQMAETHGNSSFNPGANRKEDDLKTILTSLPIEKQEALLELLRD